MSASPPRVRHRRVTRRRWLATLIVCGAFTSTCRADAPLHCLWEVHGRHNTVFLLGSIHVLRPADYPLDAAVLDAYSKAGGLLMEINLAEIDTTEVQSEMLRSATLPGGNTLPQVLGARYARAETLAHDVGVELATFDRFAPWFAAEAISQMQLTQLGFQPQSGVEMYLQGRAKADGKKIAGLETVHDQIALFEAMSLDAQADYLMSSLEQAHELPQQVDDMVRAWKRGDTHWFAAEMSEEFGKDPALYQSLLVARNRHWIPRIEALLDDDKNYLVIVGTGHLVGRDNVIELLKKDGVGATQR
jgi:uncharacterized protein YbaP (TraB family)